MQPKIRLLGDLLAQVAEMDEVAEVRGRGFMVGIDLGEHDPALRLGQRVVREARSRGAIVRPLGDVIVLMPPLAISKGELRRLVKITAASIKAAVAGAAEGGHSEAGTAGEDAGGPPPRGAAVRPPFGGPQGRPSGAPDPARTG